MLLKKIVSFEEISRLKKIVEMEQGKSLLNFIDNSNLVYDNMENLQSKSLLGFKEDFAFFKTHFCALFNNKKFIIDNNTRGVIYILRDPRDVCISWANHASLSLNKSIEAKSLLLMDYLSILMLNYFLTPIIAFTIYFCFLHSIRHSISLIRELNKNLTKGLPVFIKKALPLTILTIFELKR